MSKLTNDEIAMLELAIEGDLELFTSDWVLRAKELDAPDAELKERAQKAIRVLVEKGLVVLSRRSAWIGGTETKLPLAQYGDVLLNPATWEKPEGDSTPYLCCAATPEEERGFYLREEVQAYFRSVYKKHAPAQQNAGDSSAL